MDPYRTAPAPANECGERGADSGDLELVPVFVVLWIASVVRVLGCFVNQEICGVEPVLAAVTILLVPYLIREPLLDLGRVKTL